jgi:hypothetical protein
MTVHLSARRTSLAAAVVGVLTLTGCVAPEPMPTPRGCTPESADITWEQKTRIDDLRLGSFVAVIGDDGVTRTTVIEDHPPVEFADGAIESLARSGGSPASWRLGLLVDVRRTGQVSADFGGEAPLPRTNPAVPVPPAVGTFVTDVGVNAYRVPFTVACRGVAPVTGWISAADVGGTASTLIQCGVEPLNPSPATARAEKECP